MIWTRRFAALTGHIRQRRTVLRLKRPWFPIRKPSLTQFEICARNRRMATEITVPRLGWTMEEGVFLGWLKQEGARIKSGEPIFVLEGEKAAQEIEATEDGILKLFPTGPAVGSTVMVG